MHSAIPYHKIVSRVRISLKLEFCAIVIHRRYQERSAYLPFSKVPDDVRVDQEDSFAPDLAHIRRLGDGVSRTHISILLLEWEQHIYSPVVTTSAVNQLPILRESPPDQSNLCHNVQTFPLPILSSTLHRRCFCSSHRQQFRARS